ncbi:VOC family protein [Saccharopolyspora pogona]|uniref:VOC family protein n=1 Tax=Saccharopolyspora pogona TaxID=333966 RepID=UPI001CC26100|nr:VOC family protein [Saccharopolyspora pogona]
MPSGVNELVLEVADLAASEPFYTEVLGFLAIETWEGERWRNRETVWVPVAPGSAGGSRRWAPPAPGAACTSTTRCR